MLKSYEAIYDNGHLDWLGEKPSANKIKVIVIAEEEPTKKTLHHSIKQLKGIAPKPKKYFQGGGQFDFIEHNVGAIGLNMNQALTKSEGLKSTVKTEFDDLKWLNETRHESVVSFDDYLKKN